MKNGKVQLALGAAGGSRIPTTITQVAHRYLSQKDLNTSLMLQEFILRRFALDRRS